MRNTKQKASIQSMNNDNLNLQANNEGKGNTPGCRRINYNELYRKSITVENEMQHEGLNWKFKLCPSCLLTDLSSLPKRGYTTLLNGRVTCGYLMQWMHWYLFDAMGFVACITWTEKARQHQ